MLLPRIRRTHPRLLARILFLHWYLRNLVAVARDAFLTGFKAEMAKPSRGDTQPCTVGGCPGTCEYRAVKITEVAEGNQELRTYTICKWVCDADPSHIRPDAE